MTGFIPPSIQKEIDDLREATGHTPELTVLGPRRWRITMRNDRVEMTVDYKPAARGRLQWIKSTLTVDGQPRPIAETFEDFVRIFLDPDEKPQPAAPEPPLPECTPEQLPPLVHHTYQGIVSGLPDEGKGVTLRLGHQGSRWVIDLEGGRGQVRFKFRRRGKVVGPAGIRVVVDGFDRSDEVNDEMSKALELLTTPRPGLDPSTPGTVGSTAQGSGFDSVGVRRASVMRN